MAKKTVRRKKKAVKRKPVRRKKAVKRKATRKKTTRRKAVRKKKTVKRKAAKKTTRKRKVKSKSGKKRKPSAAFMRPHTVSAALAEVIGKGPMPRTQVTKKLWAYIKKHDLQDPKNRRNIRPDAKLAKVFGKKTPVSMFEMTKLVSKHLK